MGIRAHVNLKRIIKYESAGYFNYEKENLGDFLNRLCDKIDFLSYEGMCIMDDDGGYLDEWEIDKDFMKKVIALLKEEYDPELVAFADYKVKEIITIFENWLKMSSDNKNYSDNGFIYITWF